MSDPNADAPIVDPNDEFVEPDVGGEITAPTNIPPQPCQEELQEANICVLANVEGTCGSCFPNPGGFTTSFPADIRQRVFSAVAFVEESDPLFCGVAQERVCEFYDTNQSCCCQAETTKYRQCLFNTVIDTQFNKPKCKDNCNGGGGVGGGSGGGGGMITIILIAAVVLLLCGGGGLFYRRRRLSSGNTNRKMPDTVEFGGEDGEDSEDVNKSGSTQKGNIEDHDSFSDENGNDVETGSSSEDKNILSKADKKRLKKEIHELQETKKQLEFEVNDLRNNGGGDGGNTSAALKETKEELDMLRMETAKMERKMTKLKEENTEMKLKLGLKKSSSSRSLGTLDTDDNDDVDGDDHVARKRRHKQKAEEKLAQAAEKVNMTLSISNHSGKSLGTSDDTAGDDDKEDDEERRRRRRERRELKKKEKASRSKLSEDTADGDGDDDDADRDDKRSSRKHRHRSRSKSRISSDDDDDDDNMSGTELNDDDRKKSKSSKHKSSSKGDRHYEEDEHEEDKERRHKSRKSSKRSGSSRKL